MHTAKTVIFTSFILLLISLIGGVIFIYSGKLDVSARWKDPALLKWVIVTTRERSLEARKGRVKVPTDLDDPKVIQDGFKLYRKRCVGCHRSPGLADSEIGLGLNPSPPNFAQLEASYVDPPTYFLIVRNGIRMTAMPAWGVTHGDDAIWALVAFLKKMPGMTPDQFQAMGIAAGPDGKD